jgi:V/A-type H+-transporting ATPase subunit I
MIEKMTKYSWILLAADREDFLGKLRELGVVDITRSSKPVDDESAAMLSRIEGNKALVAMLEKGEDQHLAALRSELAALRAERGAAAPWGCYDKEKLAAFGIHYYCVPQKKFNPELAQDYPLQVVLEDGGKVWFVILGSETPDGLKEIPAPAHTLPEYDALVAAKEKECETYAEQLAARKAEIPGLEKAIAEDRSDLSLYLASLQAESAAEEALCIYEGFAPAGEEKRLADEFAAMDGVVCLSSGATATDKPPIKFSNNRFVKMFEPLTDMYGRPAYDGFDPTPFISVFFLLFFAMCMGDAGYGMILVIAGILLKKVKGFASLAPLVTTLGVATIAVGFLFHTFFSMDIAGWKCIPDAVKKVFVPSKIAGYDGTMVLALIVGVLHICLAMVVKTVNATKNKGFLGSLGVWGWTLLVVGGVIVGAFALAGVMDAALTRIVIIVLGIVSALGIFLLNDLHRNPLLNIGSGLWETYNTVTGLIGDVLSYLRLYALGLAGAMLGYAFNDLAKMALGDGGAGWIAFILIVVVGHTLNLAMAALGAFVHPLRLNFLEFFKNSGYEAAGRKYDPLTK